MTGIGHMHYVTAAAQTGKITQHPASPITGTTEFL